MWWRSSGISLLLAQLAIDSQAQSKELTKELDQVIAVKEQESRKVERMIGNLVAALAELSDGTAPKAISEKIKELEWQREQLAQAISQLKEDCKPNRKVVNAEHVFRVFKWFQRDFPTRPPHRQREILRAVVRKVVVQPDGIRLRYYGAPRDEAAFGNSPANVEATLLGAPNDESQEKSAKTQNPGPSVERSGVRPEIGMVEDRRLELLTPRMQI